MHIPRLYLNQTIDVGDVFTLPEDKGHHVSKVLRMRHKETLMLINNSGNEYQAVLSEINKKSVQVEIMSENMIDNESPLKIVLVLALARGQAFDFAIQKAVELGVSRVIPVITEYSNVRKKDSWDNKLVHWKNIIISAVEQCGRTKIPEIISPKDLSEYLSEYDDERIIMHPNSKSTMREMSLSDKLIHIIIGPEGGFSESEVNNAINKGCIPISLGPRILRLETAVTTSMSLAQSQWGDLG